MSLPPCERLSRPRALLVGVTFALLILAALSFAQPSPALAQNSTIPSAPSWLEPRGINVVDLVGLVPEAALRGTVLSYATGTGMVQYVSGTRAGNRVSITARISPRYFAYDGSTFSKIGCLGHPAGYDQWPSASPAGSMRLLSGGQDVTNKLDKISVVPAAQIQPQSNANAYPRYEYGEFVPVTTDANGARFPANMGCVFTGFGRLTDLTAVFTFNVPVAVNVVAKGSTTYQAHSYIGTGSNGILGSLNSQMNGRYGERHEKFNLTIPADADFLLVNFPPTPVDPYDGEQAINMGLPGSGTYRLDRAGGGLSVDHVNTMGIMIRSQWRDADQSGGDYLEHFSDSARFAPPEYFLPPGVPYNSCMTNGGCPGSLLEQVYTTSYAVSVHYFKIDRISNDGLSRVPLRQVGKGWSSGLATTSAPEPFDPEEAVNGTATVDPSYEFAPEPVQIDETQQTHKQYLPIISRPKVVQTPPPDDPTGCPCGWFDGQGRMLDYIAAP